MFLDLGGDIDSLFLLLLSATTDRSVEHQHSNREDDETSKLQPRPSAQSLTKAIHKQQDV